ncbi:hypothetical protein NPIL_331771 [Nephila pilipes]|uniref:Uncharacterized protein n=1 Tax=Nephila pilipes TaxID=299642 RepID=A0A8X6N5Z6_NEPPI|nr:hypothetical protein NPIL_331771 [Nephila pilipes]
MEKSKFAVRVERMCNVLFMRTLLGDGVRPLARNLILSANSLSGCRIRIALFLPSPALCSKPCLKQMLINHETSPLCNVELLLRNV